MKSEKKKTVLVIFLVLVIVCCSAILLNLNKIRTIYSMYKVDKYPLYYMKYYGDYTMDYSVPDSHRKSSKSDTEANENALMCSCFLARNENGDPIFCRNLDVTLAQHPISLLLTDAPGKNASLSTVDLFFLGYSWKDLPDRSLLGNRLLVAPRITIDGVNEYGLAVAILTVPIAEPPYDPEKPSTDEVGMMRILLDYTKTVDEAIEKINEYNILFYQGDAHFMIADASGDSAVIEFVDGETVVHRESTDWQVCTNFVLSQEKGDRMGIVRYETAVERIEENDGVLSEEEAMHLLSDISQPGTVWSVIYNLKTGETEIIMGRKYTQSHFFDLEMQGEESQP